MPRKPNPNLLTWKPRISPVTYSPDGKFLVTAMQEPMLHGWRLTDAKNMRMSGYAARIRSMAWTHDGDYLATGGSDQLILWPFHGKDGPMGKEPKLLAPHSSRLGIVACHPKQDVVAAGFGDGLVLLVRLDDAAEISREEARSRAGHGCGIFPGRQILRLPVARMAKRGLWIWGERRRKTWMAGIKPTMTMRDLRISLPPSWPGLSRPSTSF